MRSGLIYSIGAEPQLAASESPTSHGYARPEAMLSSALTRASSVHLLRDVTEAVKR